MAKDMSAQACSLQASLDRAAAERKSLEAAAALEVQRAKSSSALLLLGGNAQANADATQRVVDEVEALSKGQQQLVGLLQELREDLLGLVAQGEAGQQAIQAVQLGGAVQLGLAVQEGGAVQAAKPCEPVQACTAVLAGEAAQTSETAQAGQAVQVGQAVQAGGGVQTGEAVHAGGAVLVEAADRAPVVEHVAAQVSSGADSSSSSSTEHVHDQAPVGCVRVASVRGGVDAALAATVSGTLEL